jgi:hypothetical protein
LAAVPSDVVVIVEPVPRVVVVVEPVPWVVEVVERYVVVVVEVVARDELVVLIQ